jgi:hypothetical protein
MGVDLCAVIATSSVTLARCFVSRILDNLEVFQEAIAQRHLTHNFESGRKSRVMERRIG